MTTTYAVTAPIIQEREINLLPTHIQTLAFDPTADALWVGSSNGQLSAYARNRMRGVHFPLGTSPVTRLAVSDSLVRAIDSKGYSIRAWSKGGLQKWEFREPSAANFTTFADVQPNATHLVAASTAQELIVISTANGAKVRQIPCAAQLTHLHSTNDIVVSGSSDGFVRTHDLRTPTQRNKNGEISVKAHQNAIHGLACAGSWIYSIGWGMRQGRPFPDQMLKVFDIRNLRSASQYPFPAGPSLLEVHPARSTTVVLASGAGLINIVDILDPNNGQFLQVETQSYLTASAISRTGSYIAVGDNDGIVHMLTDSTGDALPFNGFEGSLAEWADPEEVLPHIEWTETTPLNVIGMPHYDEYLLSAYDRDLQRNNEHFPPPMKIPTQLKNSLKAIDGLLFAQMPKELQGRRNVITAPPPKKTGRFRSEKQRRRDASPHHSSVDAKGGQVPPHYRRVEIEYSKFGVEDFDFGFYNKTHYSGLETHIVNSYTNSIVQAMYYTLPVRLVAKSHITLPCPREHCLLCELGFVCRMLEDARGVNCHTTNFCKTISNTYQASTFGIIDYGQTVDYNIMIEGFNRFLIDHMVTESNLEANANPILVPHRMYKHPAPSSIIQLFGMDTKTVVSCDACGDQRQRHTTSLVVEMMYPRKVLSNENRPQADFPNLLRNSLIRDETHRLTCTNCKQTANLHSRRSAISDDHLPPLLSVNASLRSPDHFSYWADSKQGAFLKPFVGISMSDQHPTQGKAGDVNTLFDPQLVVYEIRGLVVEIKTPEKQSHLVAIIKVPQAEAEAGKSPWFVFNDFTVANITEQEALSFPANWKIPAIIYLERIDAREKLDFSSLPMTVDASILSKDVSLSPNRQDDLIKHQVLKPSELPNPGTVVAIDAEFVLMQQEESEYHTDGVRRVVIPARMSLGRVSVLRAAGPMEGHPFIDDYIHTSEPIVDYLTEYSGIQNGDLNIVMSPHTLVPLKVAYKKLRLLVDRGCIFVGHGLSKDFRIINIFVPPEQVMDTVDLYFIRERQRRLSLRFLTWYVLEEDIQQETHDSIEDARSALLLYKAFQEFEEEGVWEQKLEEIYKAGKDNNWRPPNATKAQEAPASPPRTLSFSLTQYAMPIPTLSSSNTPFSSPFQPIPGFPGFSPIPARVQTPQNSHRPRSRGSPSANPSHNWRNR